MDTERTSAWVDWRSLSRFLAKPAVRYLLGLSLFAVALATRLLILPAEAGLAFLTFYPVIPLAALICGAGPALLVAALASLSAYYIFFEPFWALKLNDAAFIAVALFTFTAVITCLIIHRNTILQRRQFLLAAIVNSSSEAIFSQTLDSIITSWNGEAERLFGFTAAEAIGKPVTIVFPPDRHDEEADMLRCARRGEFVKRYESVRVHKDGSLITVSINVSPIFNRYGDVVGVSKIIRDITERENARKSLQSSEARLRSIFDASPDALLISDAGGAVVMANRQAEALLGYSMDELRGQSLEALVPEGLRSEHSRLRAEFIATSTNRLMGNHHEIKVLRKDGRLRDVEIRLSKVQTDQQVFVASAVRDITERIKLESEIRIAAVSFESQEGMMVTDADTVILRVNRAFTETTGYDAEEIVGKTPHVLKSGLHGADFYTAMWDSINTTGGWQGEIWDKRKNGDVFPIWLTISAVTGSNGKVTHYVSTRYDISTRKEAERKIEELAYFDQLTCLPNRTLFVNKLKQSMAANAISGDCAALLFIDLDNFKTLNDTLGHHMGDLLLQQVAERLISCVRTLDTVARFGGDEFLVILNRLQVNEDDAAGLIEGIGEKILVALGEPYQLGNAEFRSTPSIGATLFNGQTTTIDELMKQVDLAMYKAKKDGGNVIRFFDPAMQAAVMRRAAMEADLREAIKRQQFLLHYQPQIAGKNRLVGAEALVRWQHPELGMVSPGEFIPLAEETGLILPLGSWVLEAACRQLARWAKRPETVDLSIAVNVSTKQFRQADFVGTVMDVIQRTGANSRRLKIELTESLLVDDVEDVINKMFALKISGVGFSMDDFGTGYSSLSFLKRLPLDQLKIDQSFVRDVLIDVNDAAIARTIVALARSLDLNVIAEGVETEEQRHFLSVHGCNIFQGYLFSPALPVEAFEALLREDALA